MLEARLNGLGCGGYPLQWLIRGYPGAARWPDDGLRKRSGCRIIRQASARRRPDRTDCQSIGAAVQQVDRFDGQRVRPTGILLHSVFPPALRRVGPRISQAEQAGSRENEPQGREWVKDPTGPREEQTVKVVRNGKGGTKRAWNPATRWS
jgi:hypothetical protein